MSSQSNSCRRIRQWLGDMDYVELKKPMPWTGISVVFASLVCVLAMAADVALSFRRKKTWVPPKLFALNAAMITFLGMAVQIPNNPGVPVAANELMKLGGMILIGAAIYHPMPSLYLMNGRAIFSSIVALGLVLVSTTIKTWYQHLTLHGRFSTKLFTSICAAYTVLLLFMYLLLVSHSVRVSAVKEILEKKYSSKHKKIVQEVLDNTGISMEILRRCLERYLMMAFTSSPRFVLFTSPSYIMFGLGYFFANVMATAFWVYGWNLKNCYHNFTPKWSVGATLVIQFVALLLVGFVSGYRLVFLWRFINRQTLICFSKGYMLHKIKEWKKIPLPFRLKSKKKVMVVARSAKYFSLGVLVAFQQTLNVLTVLLVLPIFFLLVVLAMIVLCYVCFVSCRGCCSMLNPVTHEEPPTIILSSEELKFYILHLHDGRGDNDDNDVNCICACFLGSSTKPVLDLCIDNMYHWIKNGKDKQPEQLLRLLKKHLNNYHPMLPPMFGRSWCLRLATLECIIRLASHRSCDDDGNEWVLLEAAVDECFSYAVIIDGLHTRLRKEASKEMRRLLKSFVSKFSRSIAKDRINPTASKEVEAAKMVRESLLLDEEWLGVPLRNPTELHPIQTLIVEAARRMDRWRHRDRGDWPLDAFAAESMEELTWRIPTRMLLSYNKLEEVVALVVAGCLRELPLAIFLECSSGSYGRREKHVELAARIFGETSEILGLFEQAAPQLHLTIQVALTVQVAQTVQLYPTSENWGHP